MFRKTLTLLALLAAATPAVAERANLTLDDITRPIVPTELLAGDREFGGNGPAMVLQTRLFPSRGGASIIALVTFRAEETGGDGSFTRIGPLAFEVWRSERGERVSYIVDNPGARVAWVSRPGSGPFGTATIGPAEDGALIRTQTGAGFIQSVTYLGDTLGDDISTDTDPHGDTSVRRIRFAPITVELMD